MVGTTKREAGDFDAFLPPQKRFKNDGEADVKKILYVVLEKCALETAKVGKDFVLLSSDKHAQFLMKNKKNPADYRPDVVHQCLLNLLDSPLNRCGRLQVYIRTATNVLIYVNPQCRIPRTFDRFSGLMVQLLQKLSVKAANSATKLLQVVKNPVTSHLPVGSRKILMSYNTEKIMPAKQLIDDPEAEKPLVVVIGGIATGKIDTDYTEEEVKINNYPLSAALTCAKVTSGVEEAWGIL